MASNELGELIAKFNGRVTNWTVVGWALFGVLVGSVVGGSSKSALLGFFVGVVVAGLGLWAARERARSRGVAVFTDGLVSRSRGKEEVWTWGDVDEFFVIAKSQEIHSAPSSALEGLISGAVEGLLEETIPKNISYELRRPKAALVLDTKIERHRKLGEIVEERIKSSKLASFLASFRAGNTIKFGQNLQVGPDGLALISKKKTRQLPWTDVVGVSVSDYSVTINQVGKKAPWERISENGVPNAAILAEVVNRTVADRRGQPA
jgi:hypothetical protein